MDNQFKIQVKVDYNNVGTSIKMQKEKLNHIISANATSHDQNEFDKC
uniref:Uncharacterized protein n=1 Tax=Tetranychus urticae TaxID=32264 RepID=T1KFC0_TETUR